MSHYYPEGDDALYYVEFERGGRKGEFTLFKRMWFYSKEELEKIKAERPDDFAMSLMTNEGHPWNIFTATYGPPGCMPDESWVRWMVDCLNIVSMNISKSPPYSTGCELGEIELPPNLAKHIKKV